MEARVPRSCRGDDRDQHADGTSKVNSVPVLNKTQAATMAPKTPSKPVTDKSKTPLSFSTNGSSSSKKPIELDDDGDSGVEEVKPDQNTQHALRHGQDEAEQEEHGDAFDADFDPAAFDEEELPSDDKPGAAGKAAAAGWGGTGYSAMKSFGGQMYSGMAVGGSHTWNYQPGVWKETKKEPDLWEIDYQTNKVRNHRAPTGSGAPVGTEYSWYIIAHQRVKKIDANTYETHLTGSKYKLTHKNVNQKNWDIPTVKGQRDREMALLDDAKRRIEGLPPVLSNEKVKVDRKEKGQATLGNFFQSSPAKKRKTSGSPPPSGPNGSAKKAKAETQTERGPTALGSQGSQAPCS